MLHLRYNIHQNMIVERIFVTNGRESLAKKDLGQEHQAKDVKVTDLTRK